MIDFKNSKWKNILRDIYSPEIGSIWVAPNGIWNNSFAHNKDKDDIHPSVIGRVYDENRKCWLIPGTSKDYNKGTNVYRVKLDPNDPECPYSHFLIKLRMTFNSKDLYNLQRGWNGIDTLSDEQIEDLKLQIKFCLGINV
jgi:hypothetical protein